MSQTYPDLFTYTIPGSGTGDLITLPSRVKSLKLTIDDSAAVPARIRRRRSEIRCVMEKRSFRA
jgi:hypothetical protein